MSKYNQILIAIFISLTVFNCKSQNLISNGSFENYTNPIDCGSGGFDNAYYSPIPHVLDNWYGYQSPDYMNVACFNGPLPTQYGVDVPANLFGYSWAKDGVAYVGQVFYAKGGYDKEYIYQHLAQPLQSGKVYCLSFYVSMADRFKYAIKSIGALFTNNLSPVTNGYEINATPQVVNQNIFITDTSNWVQIQGCFTANGGEQYITIGNFTTNFNTDTLNTGVTYLVPGREGVGYYYIDDISLIDQSTVGVKSFDTKNSFEIYPNPNTGLLKFCNLQYSNGDYNVKILDIFGKEIINEVMKEDLDISYFDKGVYTLLLYKNKQLVVTKKVMKD